MRRFAIPRPIEWFQQLPQILALLDEPHAPTWLHRADIERLFGVSRRQAHHLLARFGAQRLGNLLVIERQALAQALRQEDFSPLLQRHQRVRDLLHDRRAALQLARITLPEPTAQALSHLPPTIRLVPGRLSIEFTGAIDLLTQLTELSQAIGEDFDHFERLLNQDPLMT